MKLSLATLTISLHYIPLATRAQQCDGVTGSFTLLDITGACNYTQLLKEYTEQVFDVVGDTCTTGTTVTAQEDFDAKLSLAGDPEVVATALCKRLYDEADVTAFTEAANKGPDLHFEQQFYNGRGDWQEEVETVYETPDGSPSSVLKEDAAQVKEFYQGRGSYSRVSWPDSLTNFEPSTCTMNAAMCCWPKDRQAGDNNGNCAKNAEGYDVNCVNKNPGDNTNLCFTDLEKGNKSTKFDSTDGFAVFPGDNDNGEGAIHCHGLAWANDEYHHTNRYKANNLFFVSMYDHMYVRGYVQNIPGAPMCGCMDQMPMTTRSDCTQVDLTEDWQVTFDGSSFDIKMNKIEIDFNACQGRNRRNNDLWAYTARLYDEGLITNHQFGKVGRVLTNDNDCYHATEMQKELKGLTVGYTHDETTWTQVAGRDALLSLPFGREAFKTAFFEQTITADAQPIMMRICPNCRDTHKKVFYRRLTGVTNPTFDLLHGILNHRSSAGQAENKWNTDFTLHSTYDDAVSGENPWSCPNNAFNYHAPFDGTCSPTGARVDNQYTRFMDYPGPQPNVAYYINKVDNTGVQDYVDNTSVQRSASLTDVDIGNPYMPGNTWENNGVLHIIGGGNDIWGHADQFHYKSVEATGDIDVSVNLSSFANNGGDQYAKAGIMLRSNNEADSVYAFMSLTGRQGIHAQHRRSKGMHANNSGGGYKVAMDGVDYQTRAWLRIVKKAEKITFYRGEIYGADGPGNWIVHATDTFYFPEDEFRVGLAVCSNQWSHTSEATFENYDVAQYFYPSSAPSVSAMPSQWEPMVDIGDPASAGQFYVTSGIDVVKGGGDGIWGSSDSFGYYNSLEMIGDLSVEMYIRKFDFHRNHARGGLMIRESNDADSANVFLGAAGNDQGTVFQSRVTNGDTTMHHNMVYMNSINSMWVKLDFVAATGVVTASYKKVETDAWMVMGTTQLTLSAGAVMIQVGRAVTVGNDSGLAPLETQNYALTN